MQPETFTGKIPPTKRKRTFFQGDCEYQSDKCLQISEVQKYYKVGEESLQSHTTKQIHEKQLHMPVTFRTLQNYRLKSCVFNYRPHIQE